VCNAVGEIITSLGFPTLVVPDISVLEFTVNMPGRCLADIDLAQRSVGFNLARSIRSAEETISEIECPTDYVGHTGMMGGPGLLLTSQTTAISSEQQCHTECQTSTICNTFEWDTSNSRCYLYTEGEESINTGIDFNNKICTRVTHTCPNYFRHIVGDIIGWGFLSKRAENEQDCADWCDGDSRCKAFQFDEKLDGKNCALHAHANTNGPTSGGMHMCVNIRTCREVSSQIPDGFSGNPTTVQVIDYPGAYLGDHGDRRPWDRNGQTGWRAVGVSLDLCQHACGMTLGCNAFEYDTQYEQCWLLSEPFFRPSNPTWTGYVCEEFNQDCEVQWSTCDDNCDRTRSILKHKFGSGAECPSNAPICQRGQDCPLRNCWTDGADLCEHSSLNRGSSTLCTGSACSETECCMPKATCETYTGTCGSPALKFGSSKVCTGAANTCDEDTCCAPQRTCASYQGICHRKPDNTPCDGISCTFDECCEECVGNRLTFNAGWGNCLTYAQIIGDTSGATNFDWCAADIDSTTGTVGTRICPECLQCVQRPCIGDRSTWDASYGTCDTYAPGLPNSGYCAEDVMNGILAKDACTECGECWSN